MEFTFDTTHKSRILYKGFLDQFTLENLNKIPDGFNNNIIWNIGHIIATQQILVHKLSGVPMSVSDAFIDSYRKGTKPDSPVSQAGVDEIASLLFSTIENSHDLYKQGAFKSFKEYTLSTNNGVLKTVENAIEFNNFHEGVHLGSIIALKKML